MNFLAKCEVSFCHFSFQIWMIQKLYRSFSWNKCRLGKNSLHKVLFILLLYLWFIYLCRSQIQKPMVYHLWWQSCREHLFVSLLANQILTHSVPLFIYKNAKSMQTAKIKYQNFPRWSFLSFLFFHPYMFKFFKTYSITKVKSSLFMQLTSKWLVCWPVS